MQKSVCKLTKDLPHKSLSRQRLKSIQGTTRILDGENKTVAEDDGSMKKIQRTATSRISNLMVRNSDSIFSKDKSTY